MKQQVLNLSGKLLHFYVYDTTEWFDDSIELHGEFMEYPLKNLTITVKVEVQE